MDPAYVPPYVTVDWSLQSAQPKVKSTVEFDLARLVIVYEVYELIVYDTFLYKSIWRIDIK